MSASFIVPQTALDSLRAIADQSFAALATEGQVHPDAMLIHTAAEALTAIQAAQEAQAGQGATLGNREALNANLDAQEAMAKRAGTFARRAAKMPASTIAGIGAKALLAVATPVAATPLAHSVARDLVASKAFIDAMLVEVLS